MGKLDGRVALITGGGRGMGRAHAVAMAREGADIVICDIDFQVEGIPYPMNSPNDLAETAALVRATGQQCLARVADVRKFDELEDVANAAVAELGQLDILVANAGTFAAGSIVELEVREWATVVDTVLTGVFNSIKAVAPYLMAQKSGRIIATASGMGRHGTAQMSAYTAAKWGVIGLAKSAAKELGPFGVTVNVLNPGMVDTPIIRNDHLRRLWNPELADPTDADVDRKVLELRLHHMPIAVLPPEDVAAAAVFLASEDARYISGGTIEVGAGYAANYT